MKFEGKREDTCRFHSELYQEAGTSSGTQSSLPVVTSELVTSELVQSTAYEVSLKFVSEQVTPGPAEACTKT